MSFIRLFLLMILPLQAYLFLRLRECLGAKLAGPKLRVLCLSVAAGFFGVMMLAIFWKAFPGLVGAPLTPSTRDSLFIAAVVWGSGSIGCASVLIIYSLLREFYPFFKAAAADAEPDMGRRQFLQQGAGMAAAVPFVVSGYGVAVERRHVSVERFVVKVAGLPDALDGVTLTQLTDIHVGPFLSGEELSGLVDSVNRLDPDLVALTGDFIAGNAGEVAPCVEALAALRARAGIFACIGNHEIHARADDLLTAELEKTGIRVLRNSARLVPIGNATLGILGIDDLLSGHPNLGAALSHLQNGTCGARVLLSHRPEIFPDAARAGIDLIVSGHYHGGQVKLGRDRDGLSVASFLTPYADGLYRLPGAGPSAAKRQSTLFVGRGVGISGLPIRINCAPQIAHLTLSKA